MGILESLRTDPESTCFTNSFTVNGGTMASEPQGGSCSVSAQKVSDLVYGLSVGKNGKDWFFPYMNASTGGVGYCVVPIGQPEGTLALTGSMNGCALQVNRDGANFIFYHDSNGDSLAKWGKAQGTQVCRVDYKSYAGPLEIGSRSAADLTNKNTKVYFQHSILCVRSGGKWRVYVTGVHTFTPVKNPKGQKLVPFRPHLVACMTSFEDA